jgi:D-aspartate ligase
MNKSLPPALICSCHVIGLAVVRALGQKKVPIVVFSYDDKDMGCYSKYVDEIVRTPSPMIDEKGFIDIIYKYISRRKDGIIIPCDDVTLCAVARHRAELEQKARVTCGNWSQVERYIDKYQTYVLAEKHGIPAPRFRMVRSNDDFEKILTELQFPLILKPRQSHFYSNLFHVKMVKVHSRSELDMEFDKAFSAGIDMLIQEYIPGDDRCGVNYNTFFWENKPIVEFTARKIRLSPPAFGIPTAVEFQTIPEIHEPGRAILRALEYSGYACTEFKRDPRDGVYKLLEVNGRYNRSGLLALSCGINFPWMEYQYVTRGHCDTINPIGQCRKVWIDEFNDFATYIPKMFKFHYSPTQFLKPYFQSHICAVYDPKDIKPFIKRLKDSFQVIKKIPHETSRRS